jgi:hypothetical protein
MNGKERKRERKRENLGAAAGHDVCWQGHDRAPAQVVEEDGGRRERRGERKQIERLGDAQRAWRVRACLHVRVRVCGACVYID